MPAKPFVELDIYHGPLDLLLRLIEQQQLDITAISLASVTDQYMAAVAALAAPDAEALAEFLVIGAKLLVIKTRALLPRPPVELGPIDEADTGDQLARQLAEYKRFKEAAAHLREREQVGRRAYSRVGAPPLPVFAPPVATLDVGLGDLVAAMQRRLQLLLPLDPPVAMPAPKMITIADVRARIYEILRGQRYTSFEDLLSLALTRTEVIVTLWTVLELFKRQTVVIEQHDLFGAILIGRGTAFADEPRADDDPAETETSTT